MAAYFGFSRGFQRYGYQRGKIVAAQQGGGGKVTKEKYTAQSYELGKHDWEQRQREKQSLKFKEQEVREALKAKELQIEALEFQRLQDLADQRMQAQLIAMMQEFAHLKEEQKGLAALIHRFAMEDEEIYILLSAIPFMI